MSGAHAEDQNAGEAKKQSRRRKPKSAPKPASQWLKAMIAPHKGALQRKAWLDVATGVLSIAQVACLAGGVGALLIDKSGLSGLMPYAAGLFAVIAMRALLAFIAGRIGHSVSAAVRHDLRRKLAGRLAAHPPLDSEKRSAGEVAALGSDVIEALDAYASRYHSIRLQLTVIPLAIALAVAWISWAVALIFLVCGILIPFFMALVGIRAKKASDAQIAALSDMSSRFLDRLSGMTTLRLYRAVSRTRAEFDRAATLYRRATMRVLRIAFLSSAALELFAALGIALTAIYVAYHLLGYTQFGAYDVPITLSTGLFVLMLAPDFFAPLREFAANYHDKATAEAAADRLRLVLPSDQLGAGGLDPEGDKTAVGAEIERVAFEKCALGYDEGRGAILTEVSCSFERGETIAIVGASGAGKSTLLAALCGFLPPSEGQLLINGEATPLDKPGWDTLRSSIAYIGQRPHIFHGSVLMNARLAAPDADTGAVRDALSLAHADHFVAQLPRDLLTILGETGFGISGGQVRRLGIARAILSRSSLVLCDEPTADLDAETAAIVTDSLMQMAKGRLLLVATHDRAVAEHCDRILYVHEGSVREISREDLAAIDEAHLLAGSSGYDNVPSGESAS